MLRSTSASSNEIKEMRTDIQTPDQMGKNHLRQAAGEEMELTRHWEIKRSDAEGGQLPCQTAAPFRSQK